MIYTMTDTGAKRVTPYLIDRLAAGQIALQEVLDKLDMVVTQTADEHDLVALIEGTISIVMDQLDNLASDLDQQSEYEEVAIDNAAAEMAGA